MDIELRFFATLRRTVRRSTLSWSMEDKTTVREVLATLEEEYPDLGGMLLEECEIAGNVTVLRNGTHVTHFEGPETILSDGDRLSITPPVTGGA